MKTQHTAHKTIREILCIALMLSLLLTGCDFQGNHNTHQQAKAEGFYFDTYCSIVAVDVDDPTVLQEALDELERYESYFSNKRADSDISKVNAAPVGQAVSVHPETIELLQIAMDYGDKSQGAFDVTIGALSNVWNFKNYDGTLPTEDEIQAAKATVDYQSLVVNPTDATVTRTLEGSIIDLGGIAKGYAADRLTNYLEEQGVTKHTIINLGGNVRTINEDTSWPCTIGIEKPFGEDNEVLCALQVINKSIVTSGTYQRYFEEDGIIYHHLLDTTTGKPIQNGLTSVTIMNDSSVDGDALSTLCFCLGLEKGMDYIESLPDTEAIFVTSDGQMHCTSGMNQYQMKDAK